ncbi:protein containing YGGT-domain [Sulfurimonas gotlandica GD1]|uniref:Protein containing YGGT-domain n=1 Tax=Sulfurimonas gotlandica (strain DSM 19862 / JCM 16533 / GD1) TaxID=929558 RepID=B6BJE6_SULGG|nr:YggT family protein [Sulfurimonas gotlandica]EDZ62577.1 yggt family protein [Sulfurimonas gotlandica GD1]EHP31191.1 protein containing YGGT-domain [Sulfurimonas gotlandica GD1]
MSILLEIIQGLGSILLGLINIYVWVIIITALLSFVNPDPHNPIVQLLHRVTQPAYRLVRRFIRTDFNGLDLAPLVIIVALQVILVLLSALLHSL